MHPAGVSVLRVVSAAKRANTGTRLAAPSACVISGGTITQRKMPMREIFAVKV